jgi:Type II CAAX prenyl endopeptidase Rce1-like
MSIGSTENKAFNFWFCLGLEIAALLVLVVGLHPRSVSSWFVNCVGAAVYATLTAGIVSWLAARLDIVPFPLFESWWLGELKCRVAEARVFVSGVLGAASSYLAYYYAVALIKWQGAGAALPKRHFAATVLGICSSTILEEILFRAVIFVALICLTRWASRILSRRSEAAAVWTANLFQGLIFGAAHVAIGLGLPYESPWYVRLPLSAQTWFGILLGWIYWKYGLESAVTCHAANDLCLLAISKWVARLR